jgi:hypothetical protein
VGLDPQRLVFIDETWIKTNMAPLRGWAPKGERLRAFAPHGHWRTLTFLGALRCDRLTAPCVFDGPINGECFRAYVAQQLLPVLKSGDIVIMDNLARQPQICRAAPHDQRRGGQALVPAALLVRPQSNRADLRQDQALDAHRKKRTADEISRYFDELIQAIQPDECKNYFANAGYASIKT